jgi:Lrp/AsnC family transcriptional regulator, leucine-responsive regulatory protein
VNVENCNKLSKMTKEVPEIVEAHRVVGNEYYILKVVMPSMERLEMLMEKFLPLGPVDISIVLSTPVNGKPVEKDILVN